MDAVKQSLYAHYKESLEYFDKRNIVGLFLQGSQNYGLAYENSDVDTKLIVLPNFNEIAFNKKPVSTTHIRENEEHIDFKDIRLYMQTFRKQNLNFLEILFTPYKIVNPDYAPYWDVLINHREDIAHRLWRTVPQVHTRPDAHRHCRRRPQTSYLGHGRQDNHRLSVYDEQGLRGDRGEVALRRACRQDTGARPPTEHRT